MLDNEKQSEFEGKIVVVTGGTSGVGKSAVLLFAEEGAKVIFTGTNEEKAQEVIAEVKKAGYRGQAVFRRTNNRDKDSIKGLADFVKKEYGNCEILYNNAGTHNNGSVHDEDAIEKWDDIINVNLKGTFLHCHYFIPQMLENGRGVIINCSSISGICGDYSAAAYNASKGGINNLTRAMALDYISKGIRVNAICPGAIQTEMFFQTKKKVDWNLDKKIEAIKDAYPAPHIATPDECAQAVLLLASERASWINGVILPVDGGITAHTGHPRKEKYM